MHGADITAAHLMPALENQLIAGFKSKGFNVVKPPVDSDAEVEVRLRAFKFFIETGFFTGAENFNTTIALEAQKNGNDHDHTYRSSDEERAIFVPGGESITAKLNASLTEVLFQIFNDHNLMGFLARKEKAPTS